MAFDEKLCDERHTGLNEQLKEIRNDIRDARDWVVKIVIGVLIAAFTFFGGATIGLIIYIWNLFRPTVNIVTGVGH